MKRNKFGPRKWSSLSVVLSIHTHKRITITTQKSDSSLVSSFKNPFIIWSSCRQDNVSVRVSVSHLPDQKYTWISSINTFPIRVRKRLHSGPIPRIIASFGLPCHKDHHYHQPNWINITTTNKSASEIKSLREKLKGDN